MADKTLSPDQVLALLAATPQRLAALSAGLTPAQLRASPRPGEWSANEILAHLRACADMWGGAIETVVAEDRPTLRAVNPRTWINQTNYLELEFAPSLRAYARQRAKLLALLTPLPLAGWARSATVLGAGRSKARYYLSDSAWRPTNGRTSNNSPASLTPVSKGYLQKICGEPGEARLTAYFLE